MTRWLPKTLAGRNAVMAFVVVLFSTTAGLVAIRGSIVDGLFRLVAVGVVAEHREAETALAAMPDGLTREEMAARLVAINAHWRLSGDPPSGDTVTIYSLRRLQSLVVAQLDVDVKDVVVTRNNWSVWVRSDEFDGMWLGVATNVNPIYGLGVAMVVVAIIGLLVAWLLARALDRSLRLLVAQTRRIAHRQPPVLVDEGPVEIRELGRSLVDMHKKLEDARRDRDLMLAGVSHDLRTPLTRLRINLELLADGRLSADCERNDAALMIDDIEQIESTIEQFLSLIRSDLSPEAGVRCDLAVEVQRVVDRWRNVVPIHWDNGPSISVACSGAALGRALDNLVTNAVRHGEEPIGVAVTKKDGSVVLDVTDGGNGFDQSEVDRLLRPFEQHNPSRGQYGSGLGLAIVNKIATANGGSLGFHRTPNGFVARLILPISDNS